MDIDGHRSPVTGAKRKRTLIARKSQLTTPATVWPPVTMSPLLRFSFIFQVHSILNLFVRPFCSCIMVGRTKLLLSRKARSIFSPVNDKVKKLIGSVALAVLLTPLHVETGVEFDNSDVLVVVRAAARPHRARHHVTSVHRISSDLTQDEFFQICEWKSPWLPGTSPRCRSSWSLSGFPPGQRTTGWQCLLRWWRGSRPQSHLCIQLPRWCRRPGEYHEYLRVHGDLIKSLNQAPEC